MQHMQLYRFTRSRRCFSIHENSWMATKDGCYVWLCRALVYFSCLDCFRKLFRAWQTWTHARTPCRNDCTCVHIAHTTNKNMGKQSNCLCQIKYNMRQHFENAYKQNTDVSPRSRQLHNTSADDINSNDVELWRRVPIDQSLRCGSQIWKNIFRGVQTKTWRVWCWRMEATVLAVAIAHCNHLFFPWPYRNLCFTQRTIFIG